jgi:hypothetical protein
LTLLANPEFIPAHGGVSVITAVLLEPSGTPVADGTDVQFFTTLGRIDERGKTNDGVARVNLVSDSRSGIACVTAISGGPAAGGGTTTTTTTTASPVSAAGINQACSGVEVKVGSVLPKRLIVTAFPQLLSEKRASTITANVFDESGNPVSNVPIIFSVDGNTESMDSQGSPTFTDNNGQAIDVMRTRYDPEAPEKTVKVTATASAGDLSGSVDVIINPTITSPSPSPTPSPVVPALVVVTAAPPFMNPDRTSNITANVYDANGKPVPSVRVIFTVALTSAGVFNEFMSSLGAPILTNGSGQARDVLNTNDAVGDPQKTVTVTARTSTGKSGTVAVIIN